MNDTKTASIKSASGQDVFDGDDLRAGKSIEVVNQDGGKYKISLNLIRLLNRGDATITDQEAIIFARTCAAYRFDPFLNQIYLIKYDKTKPAQHVIARDTFLKIADANPAYNGFEQGFIVAPKAATDKESSLRYLSPKESVADDEVIIGGWCQVFRKDRRTPVVPVLTREVTKRQSTWNTMPYLMTLKCACAQAHRQAFPNLLGGLYSEDEIHIETPEPEKESTVDCRPRAQRVGTGDVRHAPTAFAQLFNSFKGHVETLIGETPADEQIAKIMQESTAYWKGGGRAEYENESVWTLDLIDFAREKFQQESIPEPVMAIFYPQTMTAFDDRKSEPPAETPEVTETEKENFFSDDDDIPY